MKIQRYLAALLVAPALASIQSCSVQTSELDTNQKAALKAKPAVVRVVSQCSGAYLWYPDGKGKNKNGDYVSTGDYNYIPIDASFIGTGFLIDPSGYIVTSSEIIKDKEDCIKRLKNNIVDKIKKDYYDKYGEKPNSAEYIQEDSKKDKFGDFMPDEFNSGIVILPNANVNPFEFKVEELARSPGESSKLGENFAIIHIPITKTPIVKLLNEDSKPIKNQDSIITIGYPLTGDIDPSTKSLVESTVDDGKITNANKQAEGGYPVLQTDIPGTKGIVGSPLINDQGEVIGMIAAVNGGVTLAVPTSGIMSSIKRSGATFNVGGLTEKYYLDGLKSFEKGDYETAKAQFSNVKDLFPFHSEVDRLISQCNEILADRYNNPLKNPTNLLILALVAGGGVIAAFAYFLLRRKSSARQVPAGSPGVSVPKTPFSGNGAGTQSWLELEYKGQTRQLPLSKDEHHLGRDPKWSDVTVPNNWDIISSKHATLRKEGEDYCIYDGHDGIPSTNGLWIDEDIRVDPQDGYRLKNGDQLKIGKDTHEQVVLTYYNPSSSQAAQPRETKMA